MNINLAGREVKRTRRRGDGQTARRGEEARGREWWFSYSYSYSYSIFVSQEVQGSMFNVQCSMFNVEG